MHYLNFLNDQIRGAINFDATVGCTARFARASFRSRAATEPPCYNVAKNVCLTVADQKQNERTRGVDPPEIAQSGCVFTPRGNVRGRERERDREGKRGREKE